MLTAYLVLLPLLFSLFRREPLASISETVHLEKRQRAMPKKGKSVKLEKIAVKQGQFSDERLFSFQLS
jgi:hypothetical protein